jgi:flagellar P-ring protein FlgI
MKINKILCFLLLICLSSSLFGQSMPVRLKDVGKIIESRENQLIGFGLVVGLRNSGDSKGSGFTQIALRNMLQKLGIPYNSSAYNSRNVAAVMVTSTLPSFVKRGQKISVTVSSVGDASSLTGGTLLLTPLKGSDLNVYAVAQGSVVVGGTSEHTANYKYYKNQTTVGTIPDGAIVETEVPVTFSDQHNITIVLNEPNFLTISRATTAIQEGGFLGAKAIDANTIKIPLSDLDSSDLVNTIAKIEDISLIPDTSAKVVINSRTGTVVIGEMVRLYPVALTHGNITIKISDEDTGGGVGGEGGIPIDPITVEESESKIIFLNPSASLSSLVNALNEIGATPKDLISIIEALKQSGSLIAKVEII